MAHIALSFSSQNRLSLISVTFRHPLLDAEIRNVRGKSRGAWKGCDSFQWSPAVRALSVLLLRCKALASEPDMVEPLLSGGAGSAAASLDYAISKQPLWLRGMFGLDKTGASLLRRIITRSNPERKRGGDVSLSIRESQLPANDIEVWVDNNLVENREALLELSRAIETFQRRSAGAVKVIPLQRTASKAVPSIASLASAPDFSDKILLKLSQLEPSCEKCTSAMSGTYHA